MRIVDGLRNLISGLGTERAKGYATTAADLSMPRHELEAFYTTWLGRKIVEIVPDDETREWRNWNAEDDVAAALYDAERDLNVRALVRRARIWARLYGGAAIWIGDGATNPEEPLDVLSIPQGGIKTLKTFSRWDISATGPLVSDIYSSAFGRPEHYTIGIPGQTSTDPIHHSRFILFDGLDAPIEWRHQNDGWGRSVLDVVRDALVQAGGAAMNVAELTHEAKIDVVEIPELAGFLTDPAAEERLRDRLLMAMKGKSAVNTLILGGEEKYSQKQIHFSTLPEIVMTFYALAAAAADIPATRLLAKSADGMNSTGEGDLRNYYDKIRAGQSNDLADDLRPLDQALFQHALGGQPDDVYYDWRPLWQMSPTDKANAAKTLAEVATAYVNTGLFEPELMARVVGDEIVQNGPYTTFEKHRADYEAEIAAGEIEFEEPIDDTPDDEDDEPV